LIPERLLRFVLRFLFLFGVFTLFGVLYSWDRLAFSIPLQCILNRIRMVHASRVRAAFVCHSTEIGKITQPPSIFVALPQNIIFLIVAEHPPGTAARLRGLEHAFLYSKPADVVESSGCRRVRILF